MICLGLGGHKKHTRTTDKPVPAGSDINRGSSSTLDIVSTFGGIWPGLGRQPGPSRRLDRPLRSLSQLSPEDISPAHGLGSPTPGLVPPVDNLARFQPPLLRLLGLGSHLLLGRRSFFSSRLRLCPR
jgi:hypothetical protein